MAAVTIHSKFRAQEEEICHYFHFSSSICHEVMGLEEAQAGIKTGGRNINNLRYADDTTLMAESKGELKSLLMRVKEESERAG